MSRVKSSAVLASLAGAGLLAAAGSAQATTFGFNVTGICDPTHACSANGQITPGAGTLLVVLNNTEANPIAPGDLLSSIEITTSVTPAGPSLTSQAGNLINVPNNLSGVPVAGSPTHWGVGVSAGVIVLETAGPFAVSATPINMIIGPPDGSGDYSAANGGITNGNFFSYIDQTGTFLIADAAITASTTITSVSFNFGTTPDHILPGVPCIPGTPNCGSAPPVVPEPGTLALLGSALAAFGFFRRRKSV